MLKTIPLRRNVSSNRPRQRLTSRSRDSSDAAKVQATNPEAARQRHGERADSRPRVSLVRPTRSNKQQAQPGGKKLMPLVDPVIERVLADFERRAEEEQRRTMTLGAPGTDRDELLLSVGRDAGLLLYLLATGAQSRRILELGSSYGYSTVWLAAAARQTGGKVQSLELRDYKIEHARQALTRAGLSSRVEFHMGDCLETLQALPGPFDLVLLDVWKDVYVPCFELVYPKLAPGGVICADNMLLPESVRPQAEAYRARVRQHSDLDSVLIEVGNGIELTRRRG
jgi:predicted O-methyltransferase YrrM